MAKVYGRTYEEAINYLKLGYGFDGNFSREKFPEMGFAENYVFEHKPATCACGETDGVWVYDNEMNPVSIVVICDTCYKDATIREQI